MARLPWISLALVAAAASLTTRIDAVFAAGEVLTPARSAVSAATETRVGAAIASDLQQQSRAAERARTLELRAAMVEAAEKRIESKLERITNATVASRETRPARRIVARGDSDLPPGSGDERITALVKMYQAMRPKDAARIFERLDIGLQVDVAGHMRARAAAAILAEMDPKAASRLTTALAGYAPRGGEADTL